MPQKSPVFRALDVIPRGAAFPATAAEGDAFFRTDTDEFYVYDGGVWILMGPGGGGAPVGASYVTKDAEAGLTDEYVHRFGATTVVAANDAANKELADYVCDGTDDQVQIQAANDAANGGTVLLIGKIFSINAILTIDNCTLKGEGSSGGTQTYLLLTATPGQIKIGLDLVTGVVGRLHGVHVRCAGGFNSEAVTVVGSGQFLLIPKVIDDVYIYSPDNNGTGLRLEAIGTVTDGAAITLCTFGSIIIRNFDYGVKIYAYEDNAAKSAFINGNTFESLVIMYFKTAAIHIEALNAPSAAYAGGNIFSAVQLQTYADSVDGIVLASNASNNKFGHLVAWDWAAAAGGIFNIAAGCDETFSVVSAGYNFEIVDNGDKTLIIDGYQPKFYHKSVNNENTVPTVFRIDFDTVQLSAKTIKVPVRVIDVWVHCTEANGGGTVRLDDGPGGNIITNSIICAVDHVVTRVGTINDAFHDLVVDKVLRIVPANAAKGTMYIMVVPI